MGTRLRPPFGNARPDETALAGPAVQFLSGNLRPPYFMYPTFLMYVVSLLYFLYWALGRPFTGYATLAAFAESRRQSLAPFFYLSRGVSAVMGTLTVWWIYDLARRVFDDTVAIVAALFLGLSFLHVRDSHFGVTDVTMAALIVLAVREIVRWQQTGDPWRAAAAGLAGGLATSTKYNGLGVWVPFAVATVQRAVETRSAFRAAWRRLALGRGDLCRRVRLRLPGGLALHRHRLAAGFSATSRPSRPCSSRGRGWRARAGGGIMRASRCRRRWDGRST